MCCVLFFYLPGNVLLWLEMKCWMYVLYVILNDNYKLYENATVCFASSSELVAFMYWNLQCKPLPIWTEK